MRLNCPKKIQCFLKRIFSLIMESFTQIYVSSRTELKKIITIFRKKRPRSETRPIKKIRRHSCEINPFLEKSTEKNKSLEKNKTKFT